MAKLALFHVKIVKHEIVKFLLHKELDQSPNCEYIPKFHC